MFAVGHSKLGSLAVASREAIATLVKLGLKCLRLEKAKIIKPVGPGELLFAVLATIARFGRTRLESE